MKKRLVRKTFDMVEEIANRENKEVCRFTWLHVVCLHMVFLMYSSSSIGDALNA